MRFFVFVTLFVALLKLTWFFFFAIVNLQGDFDIIGGASPLTEAEIIKVHICCSIIRFCMNLI